MPMYKVKNMKNNYKNSSGQLIKCTRLFKKYLQYVQGIYKYIYNIYMMITPLILNKVQPSVADNKCFAEYYLKVWSINYKYTM